MNYDLNAINMYGMKFDNTRYLKHSLGISASWLRTTYMFFFITIDDVKYDILGSNYTDETVESIIEDVGCGNTSSLVVSDSDVSNLKCVELYTHNTIRPSLTHLPECKGSGSKEIVWGGEYLGKDKYFYDIDTAIIRMNMLLSMPVIINGMMVLNDSEFIRSKNPMLSVMAVPSMMDSIAVSDNNTIIDTNVISIVVPLDTANGGMFVFMGIPITTSDEYAGISVSTTSNGMVITIDRNIVNVRQRVNDYIDIYQYDGISTITDIDVITEKVLYHHLTFVIRTYSEMLSYQVPSNSRYKIVDDVGPLVVNGNGLILDGKVLEHIDEKSEFSYKPVSRKVFYSK